MEKEEIMREREGCAQCIHRRISTKSEQVRRERKTTLIDAIGALEIVRAIFLQVWQTERKTGKSEDLKVRTVFWEPGFTIAMVLSSSCVFHMPPQSMREREREQTFNGRLRAKVSFYDF